MTSAIFLPLSPASNFPFLTSTPRARPFRFFPTLSTRSTRISTNRARTSIGPAAAMKPEHISSAEHSENVGNENQRDSAYDQNLPRASVGCATR